MSIEAGAKAGLISPDETTFDYLEGRKYLPKDRSFQQCKEEWRALSSDSDAAYDHTIYVKGEEIEPHVTWGTNPGMGAAISRSVPHPDEYSDPSDREGVERALHYMGLEAGMRIEDIQVDYVFIGSCTNSRLSDLRAAAEVVKGHKVKEGVTALVVPGSYKVKQEAEAEGLHTVFEDAGFEWREAGCSMCLAMNDDIVPPGKRCASTSNRNFEGRQGNGSRTHLLSPSMAAAAAVTGKLTDVRKLEKLPIS